MLSAQGLRLRQLILKHGYKIKEFAPLIGERPDEMPRIFKTAHIDMEIVRKSAQQLGVPISDITGASEDATPESDFIPPPVPESENSLIKAERDYLREELSKAIATISALATTLQNLTAKR